MYKSIKLFALATLLSATAYSAEVQPVLWGEKISPYVRKAMVALEYKDMAYEHKEILPTKLLVALNMEVPEAFAKASPLGKIPALQQGDFAIADSSVIVAYLEKIHPDKALYPSDAKLYAQALWLEEYADSAMSGVIHDKIFVETVVKPQVLQLQPDALIVGNAIKNELPQIFDYLEKVLSDNGTAYLVGDSLTVADLAVANHFVSLKLSGVTLDGQKWPKLHAYVTGILAEPAFVKVLGDLGK